MIRMDTLKATLIEAIVSCRSKILKLSSDQKSSWLLTFQPKLPVWLNFCASLK